MPEFSLLIPHDPGNAHRDRVFAWLYARWEHYLPQAEILVEGLGQQSRAANLNAAADRATTDVFVCIDADGTTGIRHLRAAVDYARANPVVVKFASCLVLTEAGTEEILQRPPDRKLVVDPVWVDNIIRPLSGLIHICSREVFERVGRWDERFRGWGGEDNAFNLAAQTLAGIEVVEFPAYHLWHPRNYEPGGEHDRKSPTLQANRRRVAQYNAAAGDPEAMRKLVASR